MDKEQVIKFFKYAIFMMKDAHNIRLSASYRDEMVDNMQSALILLNDSLLTSRSWPNNLLLELGLSSDMENYSDVSNCLREGLGKLSETEISFINMYFREGLSESQIAEKMGITEQSVIHYIKDIIRQLRSDMLTLDNTIFDNMASSLNKPEDTPGVDYLRLTSYVMSQDIKILRFSRNTSGILRKNGYTTVGDIYELSIEDLKSISGLGTKSINHIIKAFKEIGISLKASNKKDTL